MFEKLIITAFQKHRNFVVDLPQILTLEGETNVGKSSVIRALFWLCFNRPTGKDIEECIPWGETGCEVSLHFDGGRVVTRRKGPGYNEYILDGKVYEAFGQGVPDDIAKALNVVRDNFALQLDQHFWVLLNGSDLSRELNQVVDLGTIDHVLAVAATTARNAAFAVNVCEERCQQAEKKVKELEWVPDFHVKVTALQTKFEILETERRKTAKLGELLLNAKRTATEVKRLGTALLRLDTVIAAGRALIKARQEREVLGDLLATIEDLKAALSKPIPNLTRLKVIKQEYLIAKSKREELEMQAVEVKRCQQEYQNAYHHFSTVTTELKQLRESLPSTCPLCQQTTMKS